MKKVKEAVGLRVRSLRSGGKSLYLEYSVNGERHRESMGLYLVPNTSTSNRRRNSETLRAAEIRRARKCVELAKESAGIRSSNSRAYIPFVDFCEAVRDKKRKAGKSAEVYTALLGHLDRYGCEGLRLCDITPDWCRGFIRYLRERAGLRKNTQANIFSHLRAVMGEAERANLIPTNPTTKLATGEKPAQEQTLRQHLTAEEVRRLLASPWDTPPRFATRRRAFLFSCFTGLRYSDIVALSWGNVRRDERVSRIEMTIKKTKKPLSVPLSAQAVALLPPLPASATPQTKVFEDIKCREAMGEALKPWMEEEGICRHITFHCARHTFACLLTSAGIDINTVRDLLGHSSVNTTQIYAKVGDPHKAEAVGVLDELTGESPTTPALSPDNGQKGGAL